MTSNRICFMNIIMIDNQTENINNDAETNSNNFRSTLFKTNFKFIQFKKKSEVQHKETSQHRPENKESIQQFYNDLVSQETSESESTKSLNKRKNFTPPPLKLLKNSSFTNKNKNEFLKAAEKNDLKLIKSYLEDLENADKSVQTNFELNSCDDFKWNILMISVVSFSNDIVKYLLEVHSNHKQFKEIIYAKDLSGSDAEQLAFKCNNYKALEMIRAAKLKIEKGNLTRSHSKDKLKIEENQLTSNKQVLFCESCKKNFCLSDESHIEHVTSIVHQLNENEADCNLKNKQKFNYHLRASTNKGYQMLLKTGWNESGLGLNEQGRTQPVRAKQKLDRLGIGVDEVKKVSSKRLIKLQRPNESNIKSVQSDFKVFKNLKDLKKKSEKAKKFERNLRSYFNS